MRVLITGAYGLIGAAVLARLRRDGHELVGAGRSLSDARRRFPYAQWIAADFTRLLTAEAWRPLLARIDAVVNCVGVLQTGARDDARRVHVEGTCALFAACAQAGVRRVIHISATGAAAAGPTEFSRTKAEAEACLSRLDLDWLILRPGLVLAPNVHGGSAILRGIAGCPVALPVTAPDSEILVVSVEDIAETAALVLRPGAPARATWEVAHPTPHMLGDIVRSIRAWLGFPPRPVVHLPAFAATAVSRAADALGWLGWRSPARTTAMAQLRAGMSGDPKPWMAATGIKPKSLDDILAAAPATVQDRWHARLFFIKPLAIATLAAFWIVTGIVSLGPGWNEAVALLSPAGWPSWLVGLVVVAGALLDIVLGAALLVRPLARPVLITMFLVCIPYLLAATWINPALWLDPLGRLTKTIPVMLAILFTLAILDER